MYNFTKKQKIILGIIIVIIIGLIIVYFYTKENSINNIDFSTYDNKTNNQAENTQDNNTKIDVPKEIIVHISGAVHTEGIIFLTEGSRITNAIDKAGGLREDADISEINLAYPLEDGIKIYIPTKTERKENKIPTDNMQEYIKSGEEYKQNQNTLTENPKTNTSSTNFKKININTATQTQLEDLPGIGPSTALKIINYRKEKGKFQKIEDIKNVSGIGDAKFANIKEYIETK